VQALESIGMVLDFDPAIATEHRQRDVVATKLSRTSAGYRTSRSGDAGFKQQIHKLPLAPVAFLSARSTSRHHSSPFAGFTGWRRNAAGMSRLSAAAAPPD